MITDLFLDVLTFLLDAVGSLFPVADLTGWPTSGGAVADWIGTRVGPFNGFMPLVEMLAILAIFILVWLPAVAVYSAITWAYKHIPVVGAG